MYIVNSESNGMLDKSCVDILLQTKRWKRQYSTHFENNGNDHFDMQDKSTVVFTVFHSSGNDH